VLGTFLTRFLHSVFELPGGWGLNPQLFAQPPNKMPWDTPGDQFQPPAVVNDAELPVCNDNDNE
jgi:hypothetical protein